MYRFVVCVFLVLPMGAFAKVKVFFLAGQSNMVGHASVDHLKTLAGSGDKLFHGDLWDEGTATFRERDDVFIQWSNTRQGKLAVGYGGIHSTPNLKDQCDGTVGVKFGPELAFGWELADALQTSADEPIVLIKAAWGGRSLAVDFRPPSAGNGDFPNVVDTSAYGATYQNMVDELWSGLENIPTLTGVDDGEYELCGFIWVQGWNDYSSVRQTEEYASNLEYFIRDVRDEFGEPDLPFIFSELGQMGPLPPDARADPNLTLQQINTTEVFREQQQLVAQSGEFKDTVRLVPTADYVLFDDGVTFDKEFHFYGRADIYYRIGKALADSALSLLPNQKARATTDDDDDNIDDDDNNNNNTPTEESTPEPAAEPTPEPTEDFPLEPTEESPPEPSPEESPQESSPNDDDDASLPSSS